jgi:hypothetical protein
MTTLNTHFYVTRDIEEKFIFILFAVTVNLPPYENITLDIWQYLIN